MVTSKQAISLQIPKPEAGGGCEVGQNSAASQGERSSGGGDFILLNPFSQRMEMNNYSIYHMSTHYGMQLTLPSGKPRDS